METWSAQRYAGALIATGAAALLVTVGLWLAIRLPESAIPAACGVGFGLGMTVVGLPDHTGRGQAASAAGWAVAVACMTVGLWAESRHGVVLLVGLCLLPAAAGLGAGVNAWLHGDPTMGGRALGVVWVSVAVAAGVAGVLPNLVHALSIVGLHGLPVAAWVVIGAVALAVGVALVAGAQAAPTTPPRREPPGAPNGR